MSNSLGDLKTASTNRREVDVKPESPAPEDSKSGAVSRGTTQNEAMKMLSFRVPRSVHREFQKQIFEAQEQFPDLTAQEAMPAIIRMLRKPDVWQKFLDEIGK